MLVLTTSENTSVNSGAVRISEKNEAIRIYISCIDCDSTLYHMQYLLVPMVQASSEYKHLLLMSSNILRSFKNVGIKMYK